MRIRKAKIMRVFASAGVYRELSIDAIMVIHEAKNMAVCTSEGGSTEIKAMPGRTCSCAAASCLY